MRRFDTFDSSEQDVQFEIDQIVHASFYIESPSGSASLVNRQLCLQMDKCNIIEYSEDSSKYLSLTSMFILSLIMFIS